MPKVAALQGVPLFEGLSKKDLGTVGQIADEVDIPAGKTLIREGENGSQFFVLLEGEADVRRKGRKVNTLAAGDFFGEIALLEDRLTTATVTATSPVRVLVLTRSSFGKLLRDEPRVQLRVLQAVVKRLPGDGTIAAGTA
jgi:CRP-like cAMP-binding protein